MNDNLPLGAENDPNAPWNESDEQRQFENEVEDAVTSVREDLSNDLLDYIWDALKDYPFDVREQAYDILSDDAKKIWESN